MMDLYNYQDYIKYVHVIGLKLVNRWHEKFFDKIIEPNAYAMPRYQLSSAVECLYKELTEEKIMKMEELFFDTLVNGINQTKEFYVDDLMIFNDPIKHKQFKFGFYGFCDVWYPI